MPTTTTASPIPSASPNVRATKYAIPSGNESVSSLSLSTAYRSLVKLFPSEGEVNAGQAEVE